MNTLVRELVRIAADIVNPLDGMSRVQAVRFTNRLINPLTRGVFRDDTWKAVYAIINELDSHGIPVVVEKSKYIENADGVPTSKEWVISIEFTNQNGRPMQLGGVIVASGMGSVNDPLEKYDVVAYVG